jgi:hypothetical protein
LINTSFNTRGEPIVCTPRDAIESFWTSPLDALVIGSFLLTKPDFRSDIARWQSREVNKESQEWTGVIIQ